jgi:hypothetical protein
MAARLFAAKPSAVERDLIPKWEAAIALHAAHYPPGEKIETGGSPKRPVRVASQ